MQIFGEDRIRGLGVADVKVCPAPLTLIVALTTLASAYVSLNAKQQKQHIRLFVRATGCQAGSFNTVVKPVSVPNFTPIGATVRVYRTLKTEIFTEI